MDCRKRPVREDMKYSIFPSGDQRGLSSHELPSVIDTHGPPETGTRYSVAFVAPPPPDEAPPLTNSKAIQRPSGEKRFLRSGQASRISGVEKARAGMPAKLLEHL